MKLSTLANFSVVLKSDCRVSDSLIRKLDLWGMCGKFGASTLQILIGKSGLQYHYAAKAGSDRI
jgi:hypothetical protein